VSYGTMLANRFFQIFTSTQTKVNLAGVILDSVVCSAGPQRTTIDLWASFIDHVSREFLNRCSNNTWCSSKISNDALSFASTTLNNVFSNSSSTCPDIAKLITRSKLVSMLGDLMYISRDIVPAIFYRLHRCNSVIDVPVLRHLLKYFEASSKPGNCTRLYSNVLSNHILLSEMYPSQVNLQDLEKFMNQDAVIGGMVGIEAVRIKQVANWPTYALDQYFDKPIESQTQVPVLLLNGDLDIATPIEGARAQLNNLQIPNKRLIEIRNAQHGAIMTSPSISNGRVEYLSCAEQMIISFLHNPVVTAINTSCLERLADMEFSWNNTLSMTMMAVKDLYEDAYSEPYETKGISLNIALGVCAGTMGAAIVIAASMYYFYHEKKLEKERKAQQEQE
jgi:hypothetical protein